MKFLIALIFVAAAVCSCSHSIQAQVTDDQIRELMKQSLAEDNLAEEALRIKNRRTVTFLQVFESMLDNPKVFGTLELVEHQKIEIEKLQKDYLKKKAKLRENLAAGQLTTAQQDAALLTLKRETIQKLSNVFLDSQLEVFDGMSLSVSGMPRSFTESSVGQLIDLTEAEKEAIRKRSNELSKEVRDFTKRARRKAYSALFSELSPDRIEKIRKFYGEEKFKSYFGKISLPKLALDFNYSKDQSDLRKELMETPFNKGNFSKTK